MERDASRLFHGSRRVNTPLLMEALEPRWMLSAATITPNFLDYAPGATAVFTGSGFAPNEAVTLQVTHTDTGIPAIGQNPWVVSADRSGSFRTMWYVNPADSIGANLTVSALGTQGDSANATFTDASVASSTLYWDPNHQASGTGSGGSGTWDTTTANWFNGSADVVWNSSATADFGGSGGTVTVAAGGITARTIAFGATGYSLAGDTITVSGGSVSVATGASETISSVVVGSAGLTLSGGGNLNLSGANTYTGPTQIVAGTINTSSNTALGNNNNIAVDGGATLNIQGQQSSAGLLAQYYNIYPIFPNASNFKSLQALDASLTGLTPSLTNLSSATSLNNAFDFGTYGTAFPAPFNTNGPSGVGDFEALYTGTFNAPTAGTYTFDTGSDDGSMLFIDGNTVVNNNYFQPVTARSGSVVLSPGPHSIAIAYYEGGGYFGLYADVTIPGGATERLPNSLLSPATNLQIGSLAGSGNVNFLGGTLTTGGDNVATTFSGTIAGGGALSVQGGTLTLSGSNTYVGATVIQAGATVSTANVTALGNSALNVATGATLNVQSPATQAGLLAQYYDLNGNSPNSNTFISLAALNSSLAGMTPYLTDVSSATSLNNSFDFGGDGSAFPAPFNTNGPTGVGDFESVYSGTFNATTAGTYSFDTASDDGSMLFIDGNVVVNNNYYQGLTARSGSVALSEGLHSIVIAYYEGGGGFGLYADVTTPNGTSQRLSDALLGVNTNLQLGSLAGAGTVNINGETLATGSDSLTTTFNGTIAGSGGLINDGGTLTLSGTNTYTGATNISSGTLTIATDSALAPANYY